MKQKGAIITLVLVFGAIFLLLLAGLFGFILMQHRQSLQKVAWNESLHAAEAGINYYRWRLRHFPNDLQDGQPQCCSSPPCSVCGPYEHSFSDAQGKVVGKFSLEVEGKIQCGQVGAATITSTGWTDQFPKVKRKIRIKYIKPTVADFAYLINDNVWAGADREIKGPYHSNGGIRMDGENNSLVTSAKQDWICTDSFGCSPCPTDAGCYLAGTNCVCPGVFTTTDNSNKELFRYPVPPFDFEGITMDLAELKDLSKNQGQGIYLGPSGEKGYYVILNKDRVTVYKITSLNKIWAYNLEKDWHWEYSIIKSKALQGTFDISQECAFLFVEDDLWIEGEVQGKITIVAANLENPNQEANIWLLGDITYTTKDGSDGLLLLAQHNNLISPNSPDYMELAGVFVAQIGHFGRNHYVGNIKEYLEIYGSVVSNGRVGTQWSYTWGGIASGYKKRENIYDPSQSFCPPPFLPTISETFGFKEWEEVE